MPPLKHMRSQAWQCAVVALGIAWVATCAPLPRRSTAAAPAPSPAARPAIDWLSKDPTGTFVLPESVMVQLSGRLLALPLEVRDARGATHTIRRSGTALLVNDKAAPTVSFQGPVQVAGETHHGVLTVRAHPSASGVSATVELPIETYIEGVVAAELAIWSAEPAELEAQAISARTYAASALAKRRRSGEVSALEAGVMDQAYHGRYDGSTSAGAGRVADRLAAAVKATAGQVLLRGDRLEETRYHASCGGHTAAFADIFGSEVKLYGAAGPSGQPCAPCLARAKAEQAAGGPDPTRPLSWVYELDASALASLGRGLNLLGSVRSLEPVQKDAAGRWLSVRAAAVPSHQLTKAELLKGDPQEPGHGPGRRFRTVPFDLIRSLVGYGELKSAQVDAAVWSSPAGAAQGPALHLQGRGRGHGVGLCQEGARDLARAGATSATILAHYYPGATIERLRTVPVP